MFTHYGKERTFEHNKKIASLLSFVAGMVNVAGFLAVQKLTTNVTGHFAFLIDEVFKLHFAAGFVYFLYIFSFFLGSFVSSLLIEIIVLRNSRYIFVIPTIIECVILLLVAVCGKYFILNHTGVIACSLLFAMGLQNSLVTRISDAMVRTTHLTGLFTDLGIECSQLFFYKEAVQRKKLLSTIGLRLRIIFFFFTGGLAGGVGYSFLKITVLLLPAALLIGGLLYDTATVKLLRKETNH